MDKIVNLHTVCQCNKLLGERTLHPLACVIDLSKTNIEEYLPVKMDFYSVLLKEYCCDCFAYGRRGCDYSDGTVIFLRPGEAIELENNQKMLHSKGWLLAFHPELIRNTSLGLHIHDYSFFNYNKDESLHISERERQVFLRGLENIRQELERSIDKHSQSIVAKSIELLLDYCTRFYDRQFITRCEDNKTLMKKTEGLMNEYYQSKNGTKVKLLPSADYFAGRLSVSPAYFTDLLKQETGLTVKEFAESKRIELARKWLTETNKTITQVANELGYPSADYFSRLFKRVTGVTASEYRLRN